MNTTYLYLQSIGVLRRKDGKVMVSADGLDLYRRALALLLKHEWVYDREGMNDVCPECGGYRPTEIPNKYFGHTPECVSELASFRLAVGRRRGRRWNGWRARSTTEGGR